MKKLYVLYGKRFLDLMLGVSAATALSPLIAVVGLLVRWRLGSPVFFCQMRAGLHGRPFEVVKFRTMLDTRDCSGQLLPDEQRLTQTGALLRRLSLDELPQLWNVINGTMSIVGPRPLLVRYLDRYNPQQARRHEVRPGITGWAQVNGRNAVTWDERFELDVWYVDHVGFWLDVRILLCTCASLLGRRGISAEGHASMPEFMGNRPSESC